MILWNIGYIQYITFFFIVRTEYRGYKAFSP
jgi:hypothetical protein